MLTLIVPTVIAESRQIALRQLENLFKPEKLRPPHHPAAWEYCWQLVKERSKFKDPQDFGRLVAHIVAGHFLSPGYQAWIAAHLAATERDCYVPRIRAIAAGENPEFDFFTNDGTDFGGIQLETALGEWSSTRAMATSPRCASASRARAACPSKSYSR